MILASDTRTPQQHLATITTLWGDLHDALGTPATVAPYGLGLHAYLAQLDAFDADEVAAARQARLEDRADRPAGALLGERPVPIRLHVHDTMRSVEAALLELADQTASSVQRPAARALPASSADEVGLQLRLLAAKDAADRSRWSWTAPATRTAVHAAVWLTHRLDAVPGPFRPLTLPEQDRITIVAREACTRVETALQLTRQTREVPEPCPHCRGRLDVHGGDGQPPAVRCTGCGWARTADTAAA